MDQVIKQVPSGPPSYEIVTAAKEKNADLIVVGAHGRRGLQRLLGSTAISVINHATCDVLAVRFQQ
jgi:universal stress protein A